jgi:hypothetical protein
LFRRTSFLAAVAAASLALFGAAGVAPAVAADESSPAPTAASGDANDVTWGVRTADGAQGSARQNYDLTIAPGDTTDDAIVISNYDTNPLELEVYAADGFTNSTGQLDVAPRSDAPVTVGAWVTLSASHVTVPAGEAVAVPFSVAVPADATPGDYAGGVLTSLTRPDASQGITVDRRLGIRMHLRVAGDLAPAMTIDDLRVDYAGTLNPFGAGVATVTYTLRNSGNVRLSAEQGIHLAGPLGVLGADAPNLASAPEVLPGETWQVSQQVEGVLPLFALFATATITPRIAAELVTAGTSPELDDVTADAVAPAVPWALIVLVLVVAAIMVVVVRSARRRRKTARALEDARVAAAVEEALAAQQTEASTPV